MRTTRVTRRGFIHISLSCLLATPFALSAKRLRLHLLLPSSRIDLVQGALFGVEEAQRTAALMSFRVDVTRHELLADVDSGFADGDLAGIVGGHDAESVGPLIERVNGRMPVMNVGAAESGLRSAYCAAPVFHIVASDAMLSHASREAGTSGARIAAWHPSLFRYGARQLNDRYRARFRGTPGLAEDAWYGWMAVKILSDSALQSRASTNTELAAWMSSPRARFDGHKGVALTFDAHRQLRQPLYAVAADGKVQAEIAPAPSKEEPCP